MTVVFVFAVNCVVDVVDVVGGVVVLVLVGVAFLSRQQTANKTVSSTKQQHTRHHFKTKMQKQVTVKSRLSHG